LNLFRASNFDLKFSLPSVSFFALGKKGSLPSVKKNIRQRGFFAECQKKHSAKRVFAECFFLTLGKTLGKEPSLPNVFF